MLLAIVTNPWNSIAGMRTKAWEVAWFAVHKWRKQGATLGVSSRLIQILTFHFIVSS